MNVRELKQALDIVHNECQLFILLDGVRIPVKQLNRVTVDKAIAYEICPADNVTVPLTKLFNNIGLK